VPQSLYQLGVLLVPPGVQPLLELVEDQQDFLARLDADSAAQSATGPEYRG
jgi:hypothetical protein